MEQKETRREVLDEIKTDNKRKVKNVKNEIRGKEKRRFKISEMRQKEKKRDGTRN